ncbi:MAG: c-type cytochrome biogenesis protein CcmI, partial [Burkholderiaceae bacterium]|nr:c-type cytochrome biogenesis protein CcmI [Burkholderiaceae bacterium]
PAATPTLAAAAGGASVSGTVTLAPALAAKANPEDTLFVFARAVEGPRMPLAILRKQVKDLPLSFTLDDSLAMTPAARLSSAPRVVVGARISPRGDATAQPGDLQGFSAPVAPGATGLKIQISELVAAP